MTGATPLLLCQASGQKACGPLLVYGRYGICLQPLQACYEPHPGGLCNLFTPRCALEHPSAGRSGHQHLQLISSSAPNAFAVSSLSYCCTGVAGQRPYAPGHKCRAAGNLWPQRAGASTARLGVRHAGPACTAPGQVARSSWTSCRSGPL